jgi:hypothetical protein
MLKSTKSGVGKHGLGNAKKRIPPKKRAKILEQNLPQVMPQGIRPYGSTHQIVTNPQRIGMQQAEGGDKYGETCVKL